MDTQIRPTIADAERAVLDAAITYARTADVGAFNALDAACGQLANLHDAQAEQDD